MTPKINLIFDSKNEIIETEEPSKTYFTNLFCERTVGTTDEIEAMKQAIYKIIFTERYEYLIYSWKYGIELEDLFGMPKSYVRAELPRRFKEALLQDERILAIRDFKMKFDRSTSASVYFVAETIFGDVDVERDVRI